MTTFQKILSTKNLIVGSGFGLGFLIGQLLSYLFLNSGLWGPLLVNLQVMPYAMALKDALKLLLLVIILCGLAGAVCGAISGLSLSWANKTEKRSSLVWRSALSFGLAYALICIIAIALIAIVAYYNFSVLTLNNFISLFGILGLLVGGLYGLLFVMFTFGWRRAWKGLAGGATGFGLGGIVFGIGGWIIVTVSHINLPIPFKIGLFLLFLFLFGALGGLAIGAVYHHLLHHQPGSAQLSNRFKILKSPWMRGLGIVALCLAIIYGILLGAAIIRVLTPHKADIATVVVPQTVGTHWFNPTDILVSYSPETSQADLFVSAQGQAYTTWVEDDSIMLSAQAESDTTWSDPLKITSPQLTSVAHPQGVIDEAGNIHLVWEGISNSGNNSSDIFYAVCTATSCEASHPLSDLSQLACLTNPFSGHTNPAIALNSAGTIMTVWQTDNENLVYSAWQTEQTPPAQATGCVSNVPEAIASAPQLSAGSNTFALAYDTETGDIKYQTFTDNQWQAPQQTGQGKKPAIYVEQDNKIHITWCGNDDTLRYMGPAGSEEQLDFPPCLGRPQVGVDSEGQTHLLWYSNQAKNTANGLSENSLIYESFQTGNNWTEPAIVSQTQHASQPLMQTDPSGRLHLLWNDISEADHGLRYASQVQYNCEGEALSAISKAIYDVQTSPQFSLPGEIIPYCHNQYHSLTFTPNPRPAFSDQIPTRNGAFEKFAELALTAEYEVLFSTMWYDFDVDNDSPGYVLAQSIAKLYQDLKANPEQYPRGLTVRILLDNPQKIAPFPRDSQIWQAINDLHTAGVEEMENPDIGWKLEVARYDGAYPHAHAKVMVVDGKSAIAVGYNMQYAHFPDANPSGLGEGRVDFGLHASGPIVQDTLAAFDDLWTGSNQLYCTELNPSLGFMWPTSCEWRVASGEHVPEVQKYYLPEAPGSTAFSLYRTNVMHESDDSIYAALASAQHTIDITQVEFTGDFACDLTPLYADICTFERNALPFMKGIAEAIENNGVHVRLITVNQGTDGYETYFGLKLLQDYLASKGLEDHFEVRFTLDPWHGKTILIDNKVVVVGSQNFQYAAWGDLGQAEYNYAFEDPVAVKDYIKAYDYYWRVAVPQK